MDRDQLESAPRHLIETPDDRIIDVPAHLAALGDLGVFEEKSDIAQVDRTESAMVVSAGLHWE